MELKQYEEEIFNRFSRKLKLNTRNDYLSKIIEFKQFIKKDLDEVTKEDCKEFIEHIKVVYKKSTCEKIYSYLHSFYNFMLKEGNIEENVFKFVEKPSVTRIKTKDDVLSVDEINTLINSLDKLNIRDRLIIVFLITTGCLLNELVNLKWKDLIKEDDKYTHIKIGKNKKERLIKLNPYCIELITEYKEYKELNNKSTLGDDFILSSQKSDSITDRNVRLIVQKSLSICGLSNYSAKDFRHSYAAISLRLGADEEELKNQLGWSDKHYALRYKYVLNFVDSKKDNENILIEQK